MREQFSNILSELISESGKTQNLICKELKIPKQKLSNWKTGYTEPCLDDLIMLASYFHVTTDDLLGVDSDEIVQIK